MINIIKYNLHDIFRNRVVISYTVFLFLVSVSFFNLDENPVKGVMSLLNIVLIVLPMVSIIFLQYISIIPLNLLSCYWLSRLSAKQLL